MKKYISLSIVALALAVGFFGVKSLSYASIATVSAGGNQSISLPTTTVTLSGSAAASLGSLVSGYNWVQVSGPISTIISPNAATTQVSGLVIPGTYVYKLTATDNTAPIALNASDTVTITVSTTGDNHQFPKKMKSKLEINPNGMVNLQGTLMSNSSGTITVKVWGITFTINTANTNLNGINSSQFVVGDMISVRGMINADATPLTINAKSVKDVSLQMNKEMNGDESNDSNKNDKGGNDNHGNHGNKGDRHDQKSEDNNH